MTKIEIGDLIERRNKILKERHSYTGDEQQPHRRKITKEVEAESNDIQRRITDEFVKRFLGYEVDFILETLTHFGQAPNLVYDDNGMFAVSGEGYQPVVTGKERLQGGLTVFVSKTMWRKTIREALEYYLHELIKSK